jgi:hypothetical protein
MCIRIEPISDALYFVVPHYMSLADHTCMNYYTKLTPATTTCTPQINPSHFTSSLSTPTPHAPALHTNPSASLPPPPTPTFHTSNLPFFTTSHRCPLSISASSTLNAGANFSTSTLLTANLVADMLAGHEVGIAGRKDVGVVEWDVKMIAAEKRVCKWLREDVKSVDAVVRAVFEFEYVVGFVIDLEERMDHVNTSTSSRMMEWMRRCMLLCRVPLNKYSGKAFSVASIEGHDCGRKMCTWSRLVAIRSLTSGFKRSMSFLASVSAVMMMLNITIARRETLKWCSGSKRMTAAFWPDSGIEVKDAGKMAWAMTRYRREVLPAPEGW